MKKKMFVAVFSVCCSTAAIAEDSSVSLDSIDKKIDKVIVKQDQIFERVENNPLAGKRFGAELNLFRILALKDESKSISGTLSYFDHGNRIEYAVPFFYGSDAPRSSLYSSIPATSTTVDLHIRKFLGDTMNGFYLGGFSRATRLTGPLRGDYSYYLSSTPPQAGSATKLGVGVSIGYRVFSKSSFYWGCSLNVGRNIVGKNNLFDPLSSGGAALVLDDSEYIIDVEMLKFGYAF